MLPDEEIQAIVMEQESMKEACLELVRQANAAGGNDNITIVLARIDETNEEDISSIPAQ
jgi:serine/threonine protein phosphatase PrpC